MKAPLEQPHERTFGPIIGSLVIVLLLMLGALYFWAQKLSIEEKRKSELNKKDDVSSIKADLEATNVENLDQSLRTIK